MRARRTTPSRYCLLVLIAFVLAALLVFWLFFPFDDNESSLFSLKSTDNRTSSNLNALSTATNKPSPTILFWTTVFDHGPFPDGGYSCSVTPACTYTTNRSDFEHADAVVFHGHDIRVDDLPTNGPANPRQKFVFYSQEAPPSLRHISGSTWWRDALRFHWVMGYPLNRDHIPTPYGGFVVDAETAKRRNFTPIGRFTKEDVLKDKEHKAAIWFVSNCDSKERLRVARALQRYFPVDIGGKCSQHKKDLCPRGADCTPLISKYYFKFAFENANCEGYVTEKFHDLLTLPVVPIVMKRSDYKGIFPPNAFIAVDDFSSARELAEHLNWLIANPDEYYKLFEWRNEWARVWDADGYRHGICGLCEKLQTQRDRIPERIDLQRWYAEYSPCSNAVGLSWYY